VQDEAALGGLIYGHAERKELKLARFKSVWNLSSGAFAYSRRALVTFVRSVRLSVRMYQRGSHWKDFREF
jgi:hypothetical protein